MPIEIQAHFTFNLPRPADVLLQFEAAAIPEQQIRSCNTQLSEAMHLARVPAKDDIGERIWLRAQGQFQVDYTASIDVQRVLGNCAELQSMDPHALPGETVEYLFDSRYCQADRLQAFVEDEFGHLQGGARIVAMRDWMADKFTYAPGSSDAATTALDTFVERRGICRDFAHVMVTLARASTIPARFVSCFAPGVEPPDFHAVAEVFLADPSVPGGGAWHIVDATGMADPAHTVKIGVGRDAADVSFMTSFGLAEFGDKYVSVVPVD